MITVHDDDRELVRGGPLRCVLALLPDLTDEQLSWLLSERGIPHLQAKLVGCEPRVVHPDDPQPGNRDWVLELETEASLQDRGPAPPEGPVIVAPHLRVSGVRVIDCDDADDDEDPDRTTLDLTVPFSAAEFAKAHRPEEQKRG